jgi:hypothetical protein
MSFAAPFPKDRSRNPCAGDHLTEHDLKGISTQRMDRGRVSTLRSLRSSYPNEGYETTCSWTSRKTTLSESMYGHFRRISSENWLKPG